VGFKDDSASPLTQVQKSTIPMLMFAPHALPNANVHSCKISFLETAMHAPRKGKAFALREAKSASALPVLCVSCRALFAL
jgi:hypothetical protein